MSKRLIKWSETERGFVRGDFKDLYGAECSIQKSSLATENAIWLGCDSGSHYPGGHCAARMHLTVDMAKELIKFLTIFVDNGELPRLKGS